MTHVKASGLESLKNPLNEHRLAFEHAIGAPSPSFVLTSSFRRHEVENTKQPRTAAKVCTCNHQAPGVFTFTSPASSHETAQRACALNISGSIGALTQAAPTQPFYQAYDRAAVTLSSEFYITQLGAKKLMKDVFEQHHGKEVASATLKRKW